MLKKSLILLSTLGLLACGSAPIVALQTEASPALLASNNNAQCHQEIQMRLTELLGQPTKVSANVFTTESRLLLEPILPRQADGSYIDGMSLAKPKVFTLLVLNQQCLLADEQQQPIPLNFCVCQASK